ncbi:hypothetical protein [Variovorax sp. J22R115]|nr:hypothetical protein [Variovorax sp. J22R115]MDM0053886.1 hypothetical protein [Variovorax sp. J22R115]
MNRVLQIIDEAPIRLVGRLALQQVGASAEELLDELDLTLLRGRVGT